MPNVEKLVEKFRQKLQIDQEIEKYKEETVNPLVDRVFNINFIGVFSNLADEINNKIGIKIINIQPEGKSRFVVQGQHHRIYFQKSKVDISPEGIASTHVIPIYIWKGVTKHLGPITFFINVNSQEVKWNIPFESPENYSEILFSKLVEDEDFFM